MIKCFKKKKVKNILIHFRPEYFKIFTFIQEEIDTFLTRTDIDLIKTKTIILFVHKKRTYTDDFKDPSYIIDKTWRYFIIEKLGDTTKEENNIDIEKNVTFLDLELQSIFLKMLKNKNFNFFKKIYRDSFNLVSLDQNNLDLVFKDLFDQIENSIYGKYALIC